MQKQKNKKKPAAKGFGKKLLTKRNGVILVVFLAVLILVINLITLSYSWFSPEVKKGTGMQYNATLTVRSQNCAITHTEGTVTNGVIDYSTPASTSITVAANSIKYFKTTVANSDPNPTNISLYISSLHEVENAYGLGVAYPSNTYRKYTDAQTHLYILRNAYVEGAEGGTSGLLEIEWFIKTSGSEVTVDLDDLYLMYN